jgi:hypothetical protein
MNNSNRGFTETINSIYLMPAAFAHGIMSKKQEKT